MSTSTSDLHSSRDLKDWSTPSTAGAKDAMVAEGGEHLWTMPWNDAAMMLDSGWQRWRRQQAHSCFGHITSHSLHQGQMLQMLPAKPLLMPCQCGPPYAIQAIPFNFKKKHCFFAREIPSGHIVLVFAAVIQRLCGRRSIRSTGNIVIMIIMPYW